MWKRADKALLITYIVFACVVVGLLFIDLVAVVERLASIVHAIPAK